MLKVTFFKEGGKQKKSFTCKLTPVSNKRMAKWPPHSTEMFESILRGKAQNGRATYGVRESLSFVYLESYLHDFFK